MQSPHSISAFLQLPIRLLQVTGKTSSSDKNALPLIDALVLATALNIYLLRTAVTGPPLSHFLPPTIFATARTGIGTIARRIFLAFTLRHNLSDHSKHLHHIPAIPRLRAFKHPRLHMVTTESRHAAEFPGDLRFHGAMATMGLDGVQLVHAWINTEG